MPVSFYTSHRVSSGPSRTAPAIKRRTKTALLTASVLLAPLVLSACGGGNTSEVAERYRPIDLTNAQTFQVNGYLWQASLDTLSFIPLASTDATGGVIVTDWYSHPSAPGERSKIRVSVKDSRLRADALGVSVNRQVRNAQGDWIDAPVQQTTIAGLEDAILTRARQIRINTVIDND